MASVVISPMEPGDEAILIELGHKMWAESELFIKHPLELDKLKNLAISAISMPNVQCFVARKNEVVGLWVGVLTPLWYSSDLVVQDMVFYVDKEHRGGSVALRLIKAAEGWAKSQGVTENHVGLSSGVDTDNVVCFFEKMGYSHGAILMTKEMQ
tara:strand:+ start:2534 stop:2995 length:462 start_codon:yes stop_codon:yes gene_type:complete